ncbi:hypothetical protein B0H13DRAFT_2441205 [Mycena leptocephala]|nr:hypothetical protein B0H13DRAFT_2441205 [Mycena leptocephala]
MRLNLLVSTLLSVLYVAALPAQLAERGEVYWLPAFSELHLNVAQDAAKLIGACETKGNRIRQIIESATADTTGLTDKYNQLYKPLVAQSEINTDSGPGKKIKDLLTTVSDELVLFTVGREGQDTAYTNYFDTANGIIVGADNYNEKFFYDPNNPRSNRANPVKTADNSLNWDMLVGEQYNALGGDLSNLQHILRFEIENTDTKTVIDQVLAADPSFPVENGWTILKPEGRRTLCSQSCWGQTMGREEVLS